MPIALQPNSVEALFSPQWRLDRVIKMLRHRPRPLRPRFADDNDYFVRVYRRILLELAAAKEDPDRQAAVRREYPGACQAHFIHYSADVEQSQILEAWLLTDLSYDEIAQRLAIEPESVECYEKLFFNVRDRLTQANWINITIQIKRRREKENLGTAAALRGYILRRFAYSGGTLVLDALVRGIRSTRMPTNMRDLPGWFGDVFNELVQSKAAAAALALEMNQNEMMQLIKLAVRQKKSAKRVDDHFGIVESREDYDRRLFDMLDHVNKVCSGEIQL